MQPENTTKHIDANKGYDLYLKRVQKSPKDSDYEHEKNCNHKNAPLDVCVYGCAERKAFREGIIYAIQELGFKKQGWIEASLANELPLSRPGNAPWKQSERVPVLVKSERRPDEDPALALAVVRKFDNSTKIDWAIEGYGGDGFEVIAFYPLEPLEA